MQGITKNMPDRRTEELECQSFDLLKNGGTFCGRPLGTKKFEIEICSELPPSFVSLAIATPDLDMFSSERWKTVKKSIETFPPFPSQTRPLPPFLSVNLNEVIRLVKWANHPLLVKWPTRGEKLTQSKSLPFDAGL